MKPMGGGAASAADFYASQTRQSGAPAERLSLEPTHATTGKRQMQVASAPNSIARVRCIFERFAVESDGQKVLTEEAFAAYTRRVACLLAGRSRPGEMRFCAAVILPRASAPPASGSPPPRPTTADASSRAS